MAFNLDSIRLEKDPYAVITEERRKYVKRWEKTGLLEGIRSEDEAKGMAVLLENQIRQIRKEQTETSSTAGAEEWAGVALPIVRRVFGRIAAKELMSVQPMNLPNGLVFWMDFQYGTDRPGFTKGDSVYGDTTSADVPTGGLYGDGRFAYSLNPVTTGAQGGTVAAVTARDVDFHEVLGTAGELAKLRKVTVDFSGLNADVEGAKAFNVSDDDGTIDTVYPAFTRNEGNSLVTFVYRLSAAAIADATNTLDGKDEDFTNTLTAHYHLQPKAHDRGVFEDRQTDNRVGSDDYAPLDIPELNLKFRSEPILATTRKMKGVFTPEVLQDIDAYHGVDVDELIVTSMSDSMEAEINKELIGMLQGAAIGEERWSAIPGNEFDSATGVFVDKGSHTGTKSEWFQTLGNKITRVANRIYQRSMRGRGNFVVVSPDVASILESIDGFRIDANMDSLDYNMGVHKLGTLSNRFRVYVNPYQTTGEVLVGYRGNGLLETGAVYAPYVPMAVSPIMHDPNSGTPRRFVSTRYAKKVVLPHFYSRIVVSHADFI